CWPRRRPGRARGSERRLRLETSCEAPFRKVTAVYAKKRAPDTRQAAVGSKLSFPAVQPAGVESIVKQRLRLRGGRRGLLSRRRGDDRGLLGPTRDEPAAEDRDGNCGGGGP